MFFEILYNLLEMFFLKTDPAMRVNRLIKGACYKKLTEKGGFYTKNIDILFPSRSNRSGDLRFFFTYEGKPDILNE